MGLSIGQIPAAVAGLRSSPDFGRVRLREEGTLFSRPANRQEPAAESRELGLGQGRQDATPRAGFGDGTISPSGAALHTIRRTVEETRKAVPSLEDIRARFQAAAAEDRLAAREASIGARASGAENARANEDLSIRRVERRIPEAAAQARRFIGGVSDAVAQATSRINGETPQPRESGPTIQIGTERVPFTNQNDREDRPRIDVRV